MSLLAVHFNNAVKTDHITDHHAFRQNSLAINVEGEWLAFAMSDSALTHAQLGLIALTLDIDSSNNQAYVYHTNAALRLIRKKIEHAPSKPDDQLIGAVATLLIAEVQTSNVQIY